MGLRLDVYEVGPVCDLSSGSARKVEVLPAKINMMTDVVPTGLLALFCVDALGVSPPGWRDRVSAIMVTAMSFQSDRIAMEL